eukprot:jgi/Chrzof1/13438/Cz07g33070.t1
MQAQDPRVKGAGNKNTPKLVSIMVEVLGRGTELISEAVAPRMVGLLHSLQPSAPPGLVEQTFAGLTDKQKANFQTYMAGKIPE